MGRRRKTDMLDYSSSESSSSLSARSNRTLSSSSSLNGLQRKAANDRERTRMRVLSKAFVRLKTSLPWVPNDTKLSKLDTLKLAASYIAYLSRILEDDDNDEFSRQVGEMGSESGDSAASSTSAGFFQMAQCSSSKMVSCFNLSSTEAQKTIAQHLNSPLLTDPNRVSQQQPINSSYFSSALMSYY